MVKLGKENQKTEKQKYRAVKLSLATPFQRIFAYMIDLLFRYGVLFLFLLILFFPKYSFFSLIDFFEAELQRKWIILFYLFFLCCYSLGYFLFFETIWNGQTPGKRLCNIRVTTDGGEKLLFSYIFIRNMLRSVDILPFLYIIGILTIYCNPDHKRIGDIAARTIVVSEERIPIPLHFLNSVLKEEATVSPLEKQSEEL